MDVLIISNFDSVKKSDIKSNVDRDNTHENEFTEKDYQYTDEFSNIYKNEEQKYIKRAVDNLNKIVNTNWYITLPNFELINYSQILSSIPLNNKVKEKRKKKENLNNKRDSIPLIENKNNLGNKLKEKMKEFDLVFVLLNKTYLKNFSEELKDISDEITAVAFTSPKNREYTGECFWYPSTEKEKKEFGVSWNELKGKQLLELTQVLDEENIKDIYNSPQRIYDLTSEACRGCGAGLAKI